MRLLAALAAEWAITKYLIAILVPWVYLLDAADVHREYRQLLARIRGKGVITTGKQEALIEECDQRKKFFSPQKAWWAVAFTVLALGVFLLGDLVIYAEPLSNCRGVDPQEWMAGCSIAVGTLNAFGIALVLIALFLIRREKVRLEQQFEKIETSVQESTRSQLWRRTR